MHVISLIRNTPARRQMDERSSTRPGFSLLEVMIALAIVGVLCSISVPSFQHAVEQTRADVAGAQLRAIWCAERLHWLERRQFTKDLPELVNARLLDPQVVSEVKPYKYTVESAGSGSFRAVAIRTSSSKWKGSFTIDENGLISGNIQSHGNRKLVPGFQ